MTTYTDEVNIYNPDAIKDGIDEAHDAYKAVVTEVGTTGVKIHPSGQSGSGVVDYTLIDDDGMEVFDGGTSVAKFGGETRVGDASSYHIGIETNAVSFNNNESEMLTIRAANGFSTLDFGSDTYSGYDRYGQIGASSKKINIDQMVVPTGTLSNGRQARVGVGCASNTTAPKIELQTGALSGSAGTNFAYFGMTDDGDATLTVPGTISLNGATVKINNYQLLKTVPANALFTDTHGSLSNTTESVTIAAQSIAANSTAGYTYTPPSVSGYHLSGLRAFTTNQNASCGIVAITGDGVRVRNFTSSAKSTSVTLTFEYVKLT